MCRSGTAESFWRLWTYLPKRKVEVCRRSCLWALQRWTGGCKTMVSKLKCLTIDSQIFRCLWKNGGCNATEKVHLIFRLPWPSIPGEFSPRYVLFPGKSFDQLRQLGLICVALGLFLAERRVPLEQIHCQRKQIPVRFCHIWIVQVLYPMCKKFQLQGDLFSNMK